MVELALTPGRQLYWQNLKKGRSTMGSISDKISGKANEIAGAVKKNVGEATGNDRLKAEGAAQEVKGKVQTGVGKAKDAVKGTIDRI
jgi:uncharacterized protein YjbJ (UPF0337 family)